VRFPPTGWPRYSLYLFFHFISKKDTAAIANANSNYQTKLIIQKHTPNPSQEGS